MLFGAIGMVLLPSLLLIESQLSVYLSGIIQQLLLIFVVFLPVIRFKKLRWRVGKSLSGQDAAAKVWSARPFSGLNAIGGIQASGKIAWEA